jgi:hypothetical protein
VGLERGPLSFVSTIEELLGRKINGSGIEIREYGPRDPSSLPRDTLYPQKLSLTSSTSDGPQVEYRCSKPPRHGTVNVLVPYNLARACLRVEDIMTMLGTGPALGLD